MYNMILYDIIDLGLYTRYKKQYDKLINHINNFE